MKNLLAPFQRRHRSDSEALSAYVDGRLAATEAAQLQAHVASCDLCARELDELRRVSGMLASMGQAPVPRSFRLRQADIEAAAPAPAGGFGARARTYAPAMAMAAVVLFGAVVVFDVGTRNDENGSFATANRNTSESLSMGDVANGPPSAESDDQFDSAGGTDATDGAAAATEDSPPLPQSEAGAAPSSGSPAADAPATDEDTAGGATTIDPAATAEYGFSSETRSAERPAIVAPTDVIKDPADRAVALQSSGDDDDSGVRPAFLVAEIVLAAAAVGAVAWFIYTRVGKRGVGS